MLLYILFQLSSVYTQILYPPQKTQYIQWTQQGAWLDCQTNQQILAQNCNSNDSFFSECYLIPQSGLCSQQLTKLVSPLYLDLKIKTQRDNKFNLKVDDTYNKVVAFSIQSNRILLEIPSINQGFIQIIPVGGAVGFLMESYLQKNKLEPGCIIFNETLSRCIECDQVNYFMYQGHCLGMDFLTAQSGISKGFNATFKQIGDCVLAKFQDLDGNIPSTLVPRIYFLQSIINPIVVSYANISQISQVQADELQLQMEINSIRNSLPCQNYETQDEYVSECVISLALTLESVTQFQQISLMRMIIPKYTSSEIIIQPQSFTPPDECCANQSIGLFGSAQIIDYYTNGSRNYIIVTQQLLNPNFSGYIIKFKSASLTTQGGMLLILVLDSQNGTEQNAQYSLWYPSTITIDLSISKLYVESTLVLPSRRYLQDSKSSLFQNINFSYFTGQVAKYNLQSNVVNNPSYQILKQQKNNWIQGFLVIDLLILVFFISRYTHCKYRNEALFKQMNTKSKQQDEVMKEDQNLSPDVNKYYDEKQVEIKANSNSDFEDVVIMQE